MGKMPYTDWKEWATRRPEWMQEDLGSAFEGFVDWKWQDALNIAAAEPSSWGVEKEKTNPGKGNLDKAAYASRGVPKVSGAVNVAGQQTPQIAFPIMGRFEWKEMSGAVPTRVRWGSRPPSVHQAIRAEPEREERGVEAERLVPVLSEACSRSGELWARGLLEA
jgi:hypothetical protein